MPPSTVLGTGRCQCQKYSKHNRNASYTSGKLCSTNSHKRESLLETPTACSNNCTWHCLLRTVEMGHSVCTAHICASFADYLQRSYCKWCCWHCYWCFCHRFCCSSIYLCRYNKPFQCNPSCMRNTEAADARSLGRYWNVLILRHCMNFIAGIAQGALQQRKIRPQ